MTNEEAIKAIQPVLESAEGRTRRNVVIPELIEALKMAIEALKEQRPHGEWIKGKEISRTMLCDETLCIDYENFTCSVCGLVLDRLLYNVDGSLFYKFCPNCGTKMVKEGERND